MTIVSAMLVERLVFGLSVNALLFVGDVEINEPARLRTEVSALLVDRIEQELSCFSGCLYSRAATDRQKYSVVAVCDYGCMS